MVRERSFIIAIWYFCKQCVAKQWRGTVDFAEESDEEDDAVPSKRRRAERAAEGEVEDEEVMFVITTDFRRMVFPCNKLGIFPNEFQISDNEDAMLPLSQAQS